MKYRSLAGLALYFYITAVCFGNLAANSKTDAGTMKALTLMKAFKHIKDAFGVCLVKADSVVDNADAVIFRFIGSGFERSGDLYLRNMSRLLELQRIIKQVIKKIL